MAKKRADVMLFESGLAKSREAAKAMIMQGIVYVGTERVNKPGEQIDEAIELNIKGETLKYVSRGGLKLEKAMDLWGFSIEGSICMDMGASTGGFTDCMLTKGASKVYAVDVGYGQLDYKLRKDPRVIVMERTNIRYIDVASIEEIDFISIDVSFIGLDLILPVAKNLLKDSGELVALIKPQFEAGRDKVGKKGIIKDKEVHRLVLEKVIEKAKELGLHLKGLSFSPITGAKGNIEFLGYFVKSYVDNNVNIEKVVEAAHLEHLGD